jgi:hypothetical protein
MGPDGRGEEVRWVGVAPGFCFEDGVAIVAAQCNEFKMRLNKNLDEYAGYRAYNHSSNSRWALNTA